MFIRIDGTGTITLEQADDFKRFLAIATDAGNNHVWIDGHAIAALSGRTGDAGWRTAFQAMIGRAERYGSSDIASHRIKADIVRPD